jgi:hypothetical protein
MVRCYRRAMSAVPLAPWGALIAVIAIDPAAARAGDGAGSWLRVDVTGAQTCQSAASLAARVERRLGRSPADVARSLEITMVARIERRAESGGWLGEVDVLGPDAATTGRRTLEQAGGSCEPLVDRLAFVAAMILDAGAATPAVRAESDRALAAPVAVFTPPSRAEPTPERHAWTLAVEGGTSLAVGLLPGSAPGAEASLLVGPPGAGVAYILAAFWPEERASVAPNEGAALSLATVGVGLCPGRWKGAHLTLQVCLGGDLGRLRARGFGLDNQATQGRWAVDVTTGGELRWPADGRVYLALGARLVVPFVRDRIGYLDPSGQGHELFRMSPVAAVALVRLGLSRE